MSRPRIQTAFFVDSLIRNLNQAGFPTYVTQKGYEQSGSLYVLVEVPERMGRIFTREQDYETDMQKWVCPVGSLEEVLEIEKLNDYTKRLKQRDSDCWIIEVEDFQNRLGIPYENEIWPE